MKDVSKILTNKYFLYFVVFLSVTNVIAYLANNKLNAVFFFAIISLLTTYFSKNMAVVLLVGLLATNFLISAKVIREGLTNQTDTVVENTASTDPEIAKVLPIVKNAKNNKEVKEQMEKNNKKTSSSSSSGIIDADTDTTMNTSSMDNEEVEGFEEKMPGKSGGGKKSGSRLDYAATIEQSYNHLDKMLGSSSIENLTNDTRKLMKQQKNLFDTMTTMMPAVQNAQKLLKDFNINSITDSLNSMQKFKEKSKNE